MPFYTRLRTSSGDSPEVLAAKKRAAKRLGVLKTALDGAIPAKVIDGKLLLATWNLREFGEGTFRGWASPRPASPNGGTGVPPGVGVVPATPGVADAADDDESDAGMKGRYYESLFYLTEILDRFDLVALQEVRDDLEDLNILRDLLGAWWKVLITDVTAGRQGNRERVAFLYDDRKIKFGGLAGEVVLPPAANGQPSFQLARTPYLVGFQAGWFKFTICSTHLYYGENKADDPQRLKEMDLLAGFLADEAKKRTAWAKNMILLGDFNIFSTADQQYKVLTAGHGFTVPKTMIGKGTNSTLNHPYDQIAFIAPSLGDQLEHSASGIFPFFNYVYTDQDEALYADTMGAGYLVDGKGNARDAKGKRAYYNRWRSYQMSDHNPLWVELYSDFSDEYLARLAR